jgi:toxin ParE1/3/4
MRIVWLEQAAADLDAIFDAILEHQPAAATRILAAVRTDVGRLADYPYSGRMGRVAGTRELVISGTRYLVAYAVDERNDTVVVLRVLHGARRWPDRL